MSARLLAARAREAGLTPAMLTAVQVGDDDATRWLIGRVPGAVGATAHGYPVEHLLASRGGAPIASVDPEHVREVYLALRGRSDGVLVEGPSGLLSPIGVEPHDGRSRERARPAARDRLPAGPRHHQPRGAHARGRASPQPVGARADRERRERPPRARGARQPRRARAPRADPRGRARRDDAARSRPSVLSAFPAGTARRGPRCPRGRRDRAADARDAGGQPEAEAVEARAARAARHDDAGARDARAPSRPRTAARPGRRCARARGGARSERRAAGDRAGTSPAAPARRPPSARAARTCRSRRASRRAVPASSVCACGPGSSDRPRSAPRATRALRCELTGHRRRAASAARRPSPRRCADRARLSRSLRTARITVTSPVRSRDLPGSVHEVQAHRVDAVRDDAGGPSPPQRALWRRPESCTPATRVAAVVPSARDTSSVTAAGARERVADLERVVGSVPVGRDHLRARARAAAPRDLG